MCVCVFVCVATCLVESSLAILFTAPAGYFRVLQREFVVVCDFLVSFDFAPRINDYFLLALDGYYLGIAVWLKHI